MVMTDPIVTSATTMTRQPAASVVGMPTDRPIVINMRTTCKATVVVTRRGPVGLCNNRTEMILLMAFNSVKYTRP
jgi:hypothetical protein